LQSWGRHSRVLSVFYCFVLNLSVNCSLQCLGGGVSQVWLIPIVTRESHWWCQEGRLAKIAPFVAEKSHVTCGYVWALACGVVDIKRHHVCAVVACFGLPVSMFVVCAFTLENECTYNDPRAVEYMGKKRMNEENMTCIMWSAQRAYPASHFPDADLFSAENFCRNPKPFYSKSWCYSSQDAARKWGYCALRQCGRCLILASLTWPHSSCWTIFNAVVFFWLLLVNSRPLRWHHMSCGHCLEDERKEVFLT